MKDHQTKFVNEVIKKFRKEFGRFWCDFQKRDIYSEKIKYIDSDDIEEWIKINFLKISKHFIDKRIIKKIIEGIAEEDYKVIFKTKPLSEVCDCNFDNGDLIQLDEKRRHIKCGKYLNLPEPIETQVEKIKKDLIKKLNLL